MMTVGKRTWAGLCLVITCLSFACTKSCERGHSALSPEQVVEAYLQVAFNMQSLEQRDELSQYTTGPLKEALTAASDETMREAYIEKKYVLESYSVLERRDRTPRETEITFQVIYKNKGQEGPDDHLKENEIPTVTVENTVSVVREKKVWLIETVLNKKSSFYFPTATEIKAGAPQ